MHLSKLDLASIWPIVRAWVLKKSKTCGYSLDGKIFAQKKKSLAHKILIVLTFPIAIPLGFIATAIDVIKKLRE